MKKIILLILLLLSLSIVTGCGDTDKTTGNYEYSIENADVFIDVPTLRQYGDYTCGTTCVQMIMNYLYPYDCDINLKQYEKDLKTDEDEGTSGDNITSFFDENDVSYSECKEMSMDELLNSIKEGKIVMMCIQAWSTAEDGSFNVDNPDEDDYITEGHWVICVGYQKDKDGTLYYFNDPACVGHCVMSEDDLQSRWIDMDAKGKIYKHYGLVIDGNGNYDPDGAYYLN